MIYYNLSLVFLYYELITYSS